jgi:hypothetical protein
MPCQLNFAPILPVDGLPSQDLLLVNAYAAAALTYVLHRLLLTFRYCGSIHCGDASIQNDGLMLGVALPSMPSTLTLHCAFPSLFSPIGCAYICGQAGHMHAIRPVFCTFAHSLKATKSDIRCIIPAPVSYVLYLFIGGAQAPQT